MIPLRPYQEQVVERLRAALRQHRRVLLVSPTGSGKTVMFAFIAATASGKGHHVTILAHRQEITDQISRALTGMGVRHGVVAPGRTATADAVQVAMVQTLARRLDRPHQPPALLVVDEAHHAVAGSWAKIAAAWPQAHVLGVTATPERLDGRGLAEAFDVLVEGPSVADLIAGRWLAAYRYLAPPTQVDLTGVHRRMGDYAVSELAAAMNRTVITGDAVEHYARHLAGRPAIAFCASVAHAEAVAAQFRGQGWRAAAVDGAMEKGARRALIADLAAGRLSVLTSCDLISEGVDVPVVAGAILLRPTQSLALHLQQVGRALRPKPDGGEAVILDHVGNVARHGFPDDARAWSLDGGAGEQEPSVRTCPACHLAVPTGKAAGVARGCQHGAECGLARPLTERAAKEAPAARAGVLEEVAPDRAWLGGIDIAQARGEEYRRMLALSEGKRERLEQIARARKYRRGWVDHVMREWKTPPSEFQSREWAA